MPQESESHASLASPCKSLRGVALKAVCPHDGPAAEETINDDELALRKAEEAEPSICYRDENVVDRKGAYLSTLIGGLSLFVSENFGLKRGLGD
ncbi:hypothetical protein ACLOJK_041657 [Asimina triloba]